eukprot:767213-Hanusia_phi.AAC.5
MVVDLVPWRFSRYLCKRCDRVPQLILANSFHYNDQHGKSTKTKKWLEQQLIGGTVEEEKERAREREMEGGK